MNGLRLGLLVVLTIAASCAASAKEVYTWTDENGVVHFVDRPPGNPDAQAVDAPEAYRPGSVSPEPVEPIEPAEIAAEDQPPEQELSPAEQKRVELAEQRARRQSERAEAERICAEAKRKLAMIQPSPRVLYENQQGEVVRMDDDQRVRMIEENQALVDKYCR